MEEEGTAQSVKWLAMCLDHMGLFPGRSKNCIVIIITSRLYSMFQKSLYREEKRNSALFEL
jgi:hypothetical protein